MQQISLYYHLTKPERTYANLITVAAGFLLASKWHIQVWLLIATLVGTSLIIASACVINNYMDRNIDAKMARTKQRAMVKDLVPIKHALIYAFVLGLIGFFVLSLFVNSLVVILGAIAYVDYVVLYGLTKRRSVHGTLVGTVSGAMPITAGYCAVTGRIGLDAAILYLIMTFWQMSHFYAIAIYRLKDYAAAGLPVLPVVKGVFTAKKYILIYTVAFIIASLMPTLLGLTGQIYLIVMLAAGLVWLRLALRGFKTEDDTRWAKETFLFSLVVLLAFAFMLAVDPRIT